MTYVLINPRRTPGGEPHWDAKIPLDALKIGLRLKLPVQCTEHGEPRKRAQCEVRGIHWAHNWIRAEYKAGSKCLSECAKIVITEE